MRFYNCFKVFEFKVVLLTQLISLIILKIISVVAHGVPKPPFLNSMLASSLNLLFLTVTLTDIRKGTPVLKIYATHMKLFDQLSGFGIKFENCSIEQLF